MIEITSPAPGLTTGNQALEVFIHFPEPEGTRPETLRILVNGADVTEAFITAGNGAFGSVVLLVDGENTLEAGVFARSWWPGARLVEHTAELRFRVERRVDTNWG